MQIKYTTHSSINSENNKQVNITHIGAAAEANSRSIYITKLKVSGY